MTGDMYSLRSRNYLIELNNYNRDEVADLFKNALQNIPNELTDDEIDILSYFSAGSASFGFVQEVIQGACLTAAANGWSMIDLR